MFLLRKCKTVDGCCTYNQSLKHSAEIRCCRSEIVKDPNSQKTVLGSPLLLHNSRAMSANSKIGTRTCTEFQSYWTPPQVTPIKERLYYPGVISSRQNHLERNGLLVVVFAAVCRRLSIQQRNSQQRNSTNRKINIKNQPPHLRMRTCPPPNNWFRYRSNSQATCIAGQYRGRRRRGTISVKMDSTIDKIPPAPMPCIERPAKSCRKACAEHAMAVPKENTKIMMSSRFRRPKISEIDATTGWQTAFVRRNEVPAQDTSVAVPLRFCASVLYEDS